MTEIESLIRFVAVIRKLLLNKLRPKTISKSKACENEKYMRNRFRRKLIFCNASSVNADIS